MNNWKNIQTSYFPYHLKQNTGYGYLNAEPTFSFVILKESYLIAWFS
jgi:hypothetical protein